LPNFVAEIKKKLPELQYILLLFLSTRLVLTVIGIVSRNLLERQYGKQYIWSKSLGLDIWGVWDTFWYMNIASHGYSAVGINPLSQSQANYAFFPLYPTLMKILGTVLGNKYYIAGLIISNICLIIASVILYKLVLLNDDKKTALNSVKYLFISPIAFIFSGVFTESLYLAIALLCFYLAKRQKWIFVGISGFFLALTRSVGVLIIIPLVYEYLKPRNFQLKEIKINVISLLLIPMGLLIFIAYNHHLTGDPLAFRNIQSAPGWNRGSTNPFQVLLNGLYQGLFKSNMRTLLESSISIISLISLIIFNRKIDVSYFLFSIYSILIPLSTGLDSMPRYILPIFPLYILLAKLCQDKYSDQVATLSLGLFQGFLMVFWSCGFALVV